MRDVEIELCKWLLRHENKSATPVFGVGGSDHELSLTRFAFLRFAEALNLSTRFDRLNETDLKLRLALSLAPREVIDWNATDPRSRVDVVTDYLVDNFSLEALEAKAMARIIVATLKAWETSRRSLSDKATRILGEQDGKCATCHASLGEERILEEEGKPETRQDVFKPYFAEPGVRMWFTPEVDHIEPISGTGSNNRDNLQVLCKLCNAGKENGTGISIQTEFKHACLAVEDAEPQYRRRLFYNRIEMDNFKCTSCGSDSKELTVRPQRKSGALILLNLTAICYECEKGATTLETN